MLALTVSAVLHFIYNLHLYAVIKCVSQNSFGEFVFCFLFFVRTPDEFAGFFQAVDSRGMTNKKIVIKA